MDAMKLISLWLVMVAVAGVSCERHAFDGPAGTRQLHEHEGRAADPAENQPAHAE